MGKTIIAIIILLAIGIAYFSGGCNTRYIEGYNTGYQEGIETIAPIVRVEIYHNGKLLYSGEGGMGGMFPMVFDGVDPYRYILLDPKENGVLRVSTYANNYQWVDK